jgi:hypothetical protein
MSKNKNILGSLITMQDISGYYNDNPLKPSKAQMAFPLVKTEETTWKTIANASLLANEAADPISVNSSVPVAGRAGFKTIMGDMANFGKAREMTADDIEKFEKLKRDFSQLKNPAVAQQLIDFYGNDLAFVRQAMLAEMSYISWALVSNACNIDFVAGNSPYMQGIAAMDYGLSAWQKNVVATSWANAASLILTDIQNAIDLGETYGKAFYVITINKKWFTYVRNNTEIQKHCATLVQNLYSTQAPPTLAAINAMLESYFNGQVVFEVIDEVTTRASINDVKATSNPFADGVAVFSQVKQLGHFEWNALPTVDPTRETFESFFLVGNYIQIDPSYSKIYAKGRGFAVVDTYADNFYLKIDAVAW